MQFSSRHAVLTKASTEQGVAITLTDTSTNGSYVNGARVTKGQPVRLRPGDIVRLSVPDTQTHEEFAYVQQHPVLHGAQLVIRFELVQAPSGQENQSPSSVPAPPQPCASVGVPSSKRRKTANQACSEVQESPSDPFARLAAMHAANEARLFGVRTECLVTRPRRCASSSKS